MVTGEALVTAPVGTGEDLSIAAALVTETVVVTVAAVVIGVDCSDWSSCSDRSSCDNWNRC